MPDDMLTFERTAELLNRSRPWVKAAIERGQLATIVHGGREWVRRDSVEELMDQGQARTVTPLDGPSMGLPQLLRAMAYQKCVRPEERPADIVRTLDGLTGASGGYFIKPEFATEFFNRVRSYEPLGRLKWYFHPSKEFQVPTTGESSRAAGSRFGGAVVKWLNTAEGADLSTATANQPTASIIRFLTHDVVCFGPKVSENLVADSPWLGDYVTHVQTSETAFELVNYLMGGAAYPNTGIPGWSATVQVSRAGGGAIALADVDKMWQRMYAPCRRNAVWLCTDDSLYNLDTMAVTENWNSAIYMPQGTYQNPWPLLKGRPVLACEQSPALGQVGDLCLIDPSQIGIAVHSPASPTKSDPGLSIAVMEGAQAIRIMESVMERRMTRDRYWDSDQICYMSKLRADIQPLWVSSVTPLNSSSAGNTLSPFVCLK